MYAILYICTTCCKEEEGRGNCVLYSVLGLAGDDDRYYVTSYILMIMS